MAEPGFPRASTVEGLRFTAQVAVPGIIQGLFRRRRVAAVAASKANVDGFAVALVAGLKRSYGEGPLWIRVAKNEALLVLGRDAIRHALDRAPDPFAADPEPKKSAMARFQPDALTISRGAEWEDRRRFTEAVLDTARPQHRFAERFIAVAAEEARGLPAEIDWDTWNEAVRRAARRIILGDAAAGDAELSVMLGELMDKANPPGRGDDELLGRFMDRVREYVDAPADGSLVSRFADAPVTDTTKPAHQVTHWLFALGDTLAINSGRALALLVTHGVPPGDEAWFEACLQEAMRLWPTTPMLSREAVRDSEWDGVLVPAGTQVLIVNTFNHRDRDELGARADAFEPDAWVSGSAADDWQFNHFSHGPQGCPGAALALLVGRTMLGVVLRERDVRLLAPALDPARPLPHSLDYFSLRFTCTPAHAA